MKKTNAIAIIVAGGKGLRMGGDRKKQYIRVAGMPILSRTLSVFDRSNRVAHIVLVVPKEDHPYCVQHVIEPFKFFHPIHLVKGGETRQKSVQNGLNDTKVRLSPKSGTIVLIHDGVRPFVNDAIISKAVDTAAKKKACVPGVKVSDTLKQCAGDGRVDKTIDRRHVYAVQTPQAFEFDLLLCAYEYAEKMKFEGTDDASIVENFGEPVTLFEGLKNNIKLTTPEDLSFAEFLCRKDH